MTRSLFSFFGSGLLALLLSTTLAAAEPPPAGEASKDAGSVVAATPSAEPTAAISHDAESAVVKFFSTIRHPDLSKPWTKQASQEATGSGALR